MVFFCVWKIENIHALLGEHLRAFSLSLGLPVILN